ncbi:GumC family protein [Thalassospira lucentensis]|uniref:GumC family protein n=1 Tax=Thalassospira lucentensis TaxID=168935 RepID=UPI00142DBFC3|nr:tyrosine-protein kinase domain-containing protein [Thalassospira lucentensis]NIZ01280.1 AAA family ATPase [Thalassospira lucentensis]
MTHQSSSQQPPYRHEEGGFDPSLGELVTILWHRRGVVLISFVGILVMAVLGISQWSERYLAVAEVGISHPVGHGQGLAGEIGGARDGGVTISAQEIETLIAQMKSQDVLSAAAAVLRGDGVWADPISQAEAIDRIRAGLEAKRIGNAAVIEVTYQSPSAQQSAQVLQAVLESHVWWREERQKQSLRQQVQEVSSQYETAQRILADRENSLMAWQRAAGVLDAEEGKLMLERIYALDAEAEDIGRELAVARVALKNVREGQTLADLLALPDVASNPIVSQLAERFDALRSEYATLDQRYGPKHPVMKSKARALDDLRAKVMEAAKAASRSAHHALDLAVAGAAEKLKLVTAQRDQWQARLMERHDRMQGQAALLRAVEAARSEVLELGTKTQNLQREFAAFRGDMDILRPAAVPSTAEFPNRRDLYLMAVLAALFAAVVAAMLRHYFDQTIDDDFDVEARFGSRLFARIPMIGPHDLSAKTDTAGNEAVGHLAVLMRILRQGVPGEKDAPSRAQAQVIAMTSAMSGEGKSHLTRHVARVLAEFGARILVINADLHDPGTGLVHEGADTPRDVNSAIMGDMTAVLAGDCAVGDAICRVDAGGYDYLGANLPVPGNIATGLLEAGLGDLISGLRGHYDHIIVDTPPILSVADAIVAMGAADVRLFVLRCGHSKKRDIAQAMDQMLAVGIVPDGVILNGARPRRAYGVAPSATPLTEDMG